MGDSLLVSHPAWGYYRRSIRASTQSPWSHAFMGRQALSDWCVWTRSPQCPHAAHLLLCCPLPRILQLCNHFLKKGGSRVRLVVCESSVYLWSQHSWSQGRRISSSKSYWTTSWVLGQLGLQSKTLHQKRQREKEEERKGFLGLSAKAEKWRRSDRIKLDIKNT